MQKRYCKTEKFIVQYRKLNDVHEWAWKEEFFIKKAKKKYPKKKEKEALIGYKVVIKA